MDAGRTISFSSSRQGNDRLISLSVHLSRRRNVRCGLLPRGARVAGGPGGDRGAPRAVPQTRRVPLAHVQHRNAALLKRALEGDLALALEEGVARRREWGEGTTSLAEVTVREWLVHRGLRVRSKADRRFLGDNVPEDLRWPERIGDLLKAEKRLSSREPFACMGQHTHLVCERSEV
jgi:hypothetical protein